MKITPSDIHIWSTHLKMTPEEEEAKLLLLSADERQRAARFHFPIHRTRYIAARSTLRNILSRYLGIPPQVIQFSYTENKKPYIAVSHHSKLEFNVSHSKDLAGFAISLHPIGIDIEKMEACKKESKINIANRFFSEEEKLNLKKLSSDAYLKGFYQTWARKEAILKATGKGLSLSLSSFSVLSLDTAEVIELKASSTSTANKNKKNVQELWYLFPLFIHPNYQAAVATQKPIKNIQYFKVFGDDILLDKQNEYGI